MTPGLKLLVAGNWKMNGLRHSLGELKEISKGYDGELKNRIDMLVCVPATLLFVATTSVAGSQVLIGGQDCHAKSSGAHTGDISAEMIADCGAGAVIVGHSERRTDHGETDAIVLAKATAALRNKLMTIVCIGETADQRKSGETLAVLERQLAGSVPQEWASETNGGGLVIAYEPVWAIGTGLTPTADDVEKAHNFLRGQLTKRFGEAANKIRILYGGSVKPSNARELMSITNVDGALIGGASLKAADFLGICEAYRSLL